MVRSAARDPLCHGAGRRIFLQESKSMGAPSQGDYSVSAPLRIQANVFPLE